MGRTEVIIIGSGNVGSHLSKAFTASGLKTVLMAARDYKGERLDADFVILCVRDGDIEALASRLNPFDGAIVAHTSGSVGLGALDELHKRGLRTGVFYPLQTFSKEVEMDYSSVPFLIEGSEEDVTGRLISLASVISREVIEADSDIRSEYHLAAVISCNFSNHLWALADEYLEARGLRFDLLKPLLQKTLDKAFVTSPRKAQTGPAARGDESVIKTQHAKLEDSCLPSPLRLLPDIYGLITRSIKEGSGD